MNLDDAQKQTVRQWITDGLKLSEIQNKLASELGIRLTYMEMRFLLDDLKIQPKDKLPEKQPTPPVAEEPTAPEPEPELPPADALGGVSVDVDQITRPGALISGKVTFSDGKKAEWYLDQSGRLGVAPQEKGYKPSQPDLMAFQTELQNALAKMGL